MCMLPINHVIAEKVDAAAAMKEQGYEVTGSDQNVYPPMSTFLADRKIEVISGYAEQNLAHKPDLVVIGNAISRGNPEAEFVLDHRLRYCSLPELLKEFFIRGKRSIVVAGTHGKTTTTAMTAFLLQQTGHDPTYIVGGFVPQLNTNAAAGQGPGSGSKISQRSVFDKNQNRVDRVVPRP